MASECNWSQVSPQNLKYFRPSLPTSKKIYTPSAKGSGEESVLNDKREKIKQNRQKKKQKVLFTLSASWERYRIVPFFSFLFCYFLFWGTVHVWSQLFSNPGMNKQSICHKRLPPTCFVLQFFFNLGEGVQMQPKLDDIQLAALSFFFLLFIYLFIFVLQRPCLNVFLKNN